MQTNVPEQRISTSSINVGSVERVASVVGGAALVAFGLMRRSRSGLGLAATGGMMLYRGLGGHCLLYRALGITRTGSGDEQVGQLGVKLEREIPSTSSRRKSTRSGAISGTCRSSCPIWSPCRSCPSIALTGE